MTVPTFAARRKAWSSPPVDDIGYLPATDLLQMPDDQFKQVMTQMWRNRYWGWRNHRNRWWELFELGHNHGRVLDYGCGTGMEGLQFALAGSEVWLADISSGNLAVATRLFDLYGQQPAGTVLIGEKPPRMQEPFNLIHCSGVLHHIPEPLPVIERFHESLNDGGRVNLMLYSDKAWRKATGTHPPRGTPTRDHPDFERFWQAWDPVGGYADWYDHAKLIDWFGDLFTVRETADLTVGGEYLGAVLVKRG
jgi:SAM-dependent methyltransferase